MYWLVFPCLTTTNTLSQVARRGYVVQLMRRNEELDTQLPFLWNSDVIQQQLFNKGKIKM